MNFDLTTRDDKDLVLLAASGEIDVHTSTSLRARIAEVLRPDTPLVVDLTAVEFMDSTALGVLVAGLNRANEIGGGMSLVCGNPRLIKLFRLTGLDGVFTIHPTEAEARTALTTAE